MHFNPQLPNEQKALEPGSVLEFLIFFERFEIEGYDVSGDLASSSCSVRDTKTSRTSNNKQSRKTLCPSGKQIQNLKLRDMMFTTDYERLIIGDNYEIRDNNI